GPVEDPDERRTRRRQWSLQGLGGSRLPIRVAVSRRRGPVGVGHVKPANGPRERLRYSLAVSLAGFFGKNHAGTRVHTTSMTAITNTAVYACERSCTTLVENPASSD